MKKDPEDKEEYLDIFNSIEEHILLWIEPWYLEFTVSTDDMFTIIGTGPVRGRFAVYYLKNQITVCTRPGSKVKVIKNSRAVEELNDSLRVLPEPSF